MSKVNLFLDAHHDRRFFVAGVLAVFILTTMYTLPAIAQQKRSPDDTAKRSHVFPHLADGGGWQSVLLVTNVSQSASRCTFNVYGVPLNRFRDLSGVTAAGSTATFQLKGTGGYLIWDTKNELAAVASGYATLDCSAPVVAQVVFASFDGLGVTAAATVFSAQAATSFQFPVLQPAATLGFAIANDTNAEASCGIVLEDTQRTNLGEATLSVPAKSNRAQMLNDAIAIPGTFFGGTATVSCNQPVAMIGLHFELRDGTIITFNTLPPAILSTATTFDLDRFQLFNECRPVSVQVDIHTGTPPVGLTREALHRTAELKLRSARLYSDDATDDYLYVTASYEDLHLGTRMLGWSFSVRVRFERLVSEARSGEAGSATTWDEGSIGHVGTDGSADFILGGVAQKVDNFVLEYLRVNEEACE